MKQKISNQHILGIALALTTFLSIIIFAKLVIAAGQAPQWNSTLSFPYDAGEFDEDLNPAFTYNFSANVSDQENDPLTFSLSTGEGGGGNPITSTLHGSQPTSFFTWISLNTTTGVLTINATNDTQAGVYNISVDVSDGTSSAGARVFVFDVNATNDAPEFTNLQNQSFNETELFDYIINITDEEDDTPFKLNITFTNCTVAAWSTRDCDTAGPNGRDLFNDTHYTFNDTTGILNLSFTPQRNDVGSYIINFTIEDSGNQTTPFNATRSEIINFTVLDINDAPYFVYVCDNERNTTEDSPFSCYINITDVDETNNMTFSANYTWFTFNNSQTSTEVITMSPGNASALVNFTATDTEVGNWSINITITDTGSPMQSNATTFTFFIENVNDTLSFPIIENITAFTSNNYSVFINITDDDLLIPDETVYNETITALSNDSRVSVVATEISGTNKTELNLSFDPNDFGEGGPYIINITTHDANNFSQSSQFFNFTVVQNDPPEWNQTITTSFSINEDSNLYLNLSENVTDADADTLTFSNASGFPAFFLNTTTGEVNFTPTDQDVGEHIFNITATDGITPASQEFNFTIININDAPNIDSFDNATDIDIGTEETIREDDETTFNVRVTDEDFLIPSSTETLTFNWTLEGPNTTLLSFSQSLQSGSLTIFSTTFTPQQTDIGDYNLTLNATDANGTSSIFLFNLTVANNEDAPIMTNVGNLEFSIFEAINLDVNVTDEEDGNDTSGTTNQNLTFTLTNQTVGGDFLTINATSGLINFTFNQTYAGRWEYNLTVNDSTNRVDSELFNISVYDYPIILTPAETFQFNLKENSTTELNFSANHSVQNNLNYTILFGSVTRNVTSGAGDATDFLFNITANFTEETTCSGTINLTLNVSNSKLSNTTSWNLTINHTNFPLTFISNFEDKENQASPVVINLTDHYQDFDASDGCVNQTVTFSHTEIVNSTSGGSISVSVVDWINASTPSITFSASTDASANYSITAFEYQNSSTNSSIINNRTSNNFTIEISESTSTTTTPTPSSGGGSSRKEKIISLKIIVPEPVSAKKKDKLIVPIGIINDGTVDLDDIILDGIVAKDGLLRTDLIASFDRSFIDFLPAGGRENVTMVVDIDTTSTGLFEVTINGTVRDPEYNDWGKFFIEIEEEKDILERIIFTEEFIVGNPECAELKEIVDRARELYSLGNFQEASELTQQAIDACEQAIAQPPSRRVFERLRGQVLNYVTFASILAVVLGLGYYYYKRMQIKRALKGYAQLK